MVDLLHDLRSKAGLPESPTPSYGTTDTADAAGGGEGRGRRNSGSAESLLNAAQGTVMAELTELHRRINPLLQDLRTIGHKIKVGTKEAVTATSPEKERKIGNKIAEITEEGKGKIVEIKAVLEQLKRIQSEEAADMTPAETQMCGTIIGSSGQTFKKNLSDYLKAQEDYRAAVKGKVARQLRIAYPEAADDEIEELANEDPSSVRAAINQQMIRGGHASLHQTLTDLHDKYSDLKRLEESVLEVRDLFLYLSALVEEQGEKLDNIEIHVENTREYTGQAVLQLEKAKEHKESYESKRMWLYLLTSGASIVFIIICFMTVCAPLLGIGSTVTGCFGICGKAAATGR